MEIEVQEDFLSFDADLVAEQLTYMDAVSGGEVRRKQQGWVGSASRVGGKKVARVTSLRCFVGVVILTPGPVLLL